MPEGTSNEDIKASYKDGILEVRVPLPKSGAKKESLKVPVVQA